MPFGRGPALGEPAAKKGLWCMYPYMCLRGFVWVLAPSRMPQGRNGLLVSPVKHIIKRMGVHCLPWKKSIISFDFSNLFVKKKKDGAFFFH